ncbi:extracellular solute-binding protein [Oceanicella sp. SM1341]|uniref:extracellular solute-binding protein n=1 Tax=Oceanicella sp. SM1341 TaxID=1548889 RepID=UPI000E4F4362|nr:extracellular solute-binding protein [Oceanicella sp. SM1341]
MPRLSRAPARVAAALVATALAGPALAEGELNALIWCDHADPALLEPFEQAHDVKVNVKEYEGTGAALAILDQSRPGDWDVMVVDGVDVPRLVGLDLLAPLPDDALPMADLFPEVVMEESNAVDGTFYAATEKFGYNTISYNKAKVDPEDMKDLTMMWSEKYAGRIAIYDYYVPIEGLVALGLGIPTAELSSGDIPAIREKLFAMKKVARSVGEVVSSQTALATGEVDILVGGGEWVTAVLAQENPDLDWVVPEQGALRWAQSIAVMRDAANPELAVEFVKYILSPEGQARLATSSCYWGMPANAKAGEVLTPEQKQILRWDDQPAYLANTQLYPVADEDLDIEMQDAWTEMLQQ